MAVNQLQIPSSGNINNTVDQSQWATLGNLGNVYQAAQAQARKQAALASLGTDPAANQQILLTSQDPALAQLGLSLQEKGVEQGRQDARYKVTDARADAELAIRKAAEARAQGNYEEADKVAGRHQLPALRLPKLRCCAVWYTVRTTSARLRSRTRCCGKRRRPSQLCQPRRRRKPPKPARAANCAPPRSQTAPVPPRFNRGQRCNQPRQQFRP